MAARAARQREVINLVSDDTDSSDDEVQEVTPRPPPAAARETQRGFDDGDLIMEDYVDFDGGMPGAFPGAGPAAPARATPSRGEPLGGEIVIVDGEEVFIPHDPGSPPRPAPVANNSTNIDEEVALPLNNEVMTGDDCLAQVLAIIPDVSHEHVNKLYNDCDQDLSGPSKVENVIDKLLAGDYPKHEKGKQKKRKRDDEDNEADAKRWEGPNRDAPPAHVRTSITAMLKAEFPDATHRFIQQLITTHRHFYQTYVALAKSKDSNDRAGWTGHAPRGELASAEVIAANTGHQPLLEELRAARKKVQSVRVERRAEDAQKRAEQENLDRAILAGETAECQACFEELPMNRQIHCNGETAHFTCFDCATTYVKSEVGESRCRVLCTAGCGAGFAHAQLHLLSDKKLLEKLEQLQQEKDIRDAGLDDLEECPFCDYKAIMPPVEENFEFRCANPECEKVSCRRCKAISHVPMSCEEVAKDKKLNTRHKIEEAMTAAMVRSCNSCKKQFIKEYGCNKMTCPSCGHLQCYVCSQSLKNYDHFDQNPSGARTGARTKCPLYDNVEERHEREVKEAEAAARAEAIQDNPEVSEGDLEIKVSDAVNKATRDRIQRGGADFHGMAPPPGLLARLPRPGHVFGFGAANVDEDDDEWEEGDEEDDLLGAAFRGMDRGRAGRARRMNELRNRFDDVLGQRQRIAQADARLRQAQPPPQPQHVNARPANQPPRIQGYIPVFGANPPLPQFQAAQPPAAHPNPQHQAPNANDGAGQVLGQAPRAQNPLGGPDFFDAFFEDPFGGADANPFGFDRLMNGAPVPGIQPPNPPVAAQPQGAGNVGEFMRMRLQQQRQQIAQLQLQQAQAQQLQALQNMHNRAGGQGQVRQLARGDPRRLHQGRGWPDGPQAG